MVCTLTVLFLIGGASVIISEARGQAQTSYQSEILLYESLNSAPEIPQKPEGPVGGLFHKKVRVGNSYTYTTVTTDPDGDQVYYNWSWGDGIYSGWDGPYDSGVGVFGSHTWTEAGIYEVKVKAKDIHDAESDWSDPLTVEVWNKFPGSTQCPSQSSSSQQYSSSPSSQLIINAQQPSTSPSGQIQGQSTQLQSNQENQAKVTVR